MGCFILHSVTDDISEIHGARVVTCASNGPTLRTEQDAVDLLAAAYFEQPDYFAIPVGRLDPEFFTLSSGIAGALMQKFIQYGARVVVVGDISAHVERSNAFRSFVDETNRGRQFWFVADPAELDARLAALTQRS